MTCYIEEFHNSQFVWVDDLSLDLQQQPRLLPNGRSGVQSPLGYFIRVPRNVAQDIIDATRCPE